MNLLLRFNPQQLHPLDQSQALHVYAGFNAYCIDGLICFPSSRKYALTEVNHFYQGYFYALGINGKFVECRVRHEPDKTHFYSTQTGELVFTVQPDTGKFQLYILPHKVSGDITVIAYAQANPPGEST